MRIPKVHLIRDKNVLTLCKFDTTRTDYRAFATTENVAEVTCGRCLAIINKQGVNLYIPLELNALIRFHWQESETLRKLVREMGEWIGQNGWPCQDNMTDSEVEYYNRGEEILNRPQVKEIMEGIGPEDMPKSEDMVCPQER